MRSGLVSTVQLAAFGAISFSLAACQPPPAATPATPVIDTAAIATAIKAKETAWNAAWAARDAAKVAANYAPDAVLMIPGQPIGVGTEAITKLDQGTLADPAFTLTFAADRVDVAASGDIAVSTGKYKATYTDPVTKKLVHEEGGYVTEYKKQPDGSWAAVSDINAAAAPATPAKS